MRILIDVGHPAHVHLFENAIRVETVQIDGKTD